MTAFDQAHRQAKIKSIRHTIDQSLALLGLERANLPAQTEDEVLEGIARVMRSRGAIAAADAAARVAAVARELGI